LLEGHADAEPPVEWLVSRVCEEFGCLPRAAVAELYDDPELMALTILRLRAYARAKQDIDNAKRPQDMPTGPAADLVWEIQAEIAAERKAAKDEHGRANC